MTNIIQHLINKKHVFDKFSAKDFFYKINQLKINLNLTVKVIIIKLIILPYIISLN